MTYGRKLSDLNTSATFGEAKLQCHMANDSNNLKLSPQRLNTATLKLNLNKLSSPAAKTFGAVDFGL